MENKKGDNVKYLVLGSHGQIGEGLCSFLDSLNMEYESMDIVKDSSHDLRIKTNPVLEKKIKECDFVFFLAFDVGGARYLAKYQHTFEFFHNNILIMSNVFELLEKYNKKFIFASSQMSNMSYSPYGVTKAVGERYTDALGGLTVKFWNVYGPERDLEKAHVITDFILKAKNHRLIDMMTDGTEVRQFLHVEDCSRCLLTLAEKYVILDKSREYHITSFKWNSILDIAETIAQHFPGTSIVPAEAKDTVQKDKRNEADPYILEFWHPQIDIKEGISQIIKEIK